MVTLVTYEEKIGKRLYLTISKMYMAVIDVSKLTKEQRIKLLEKAKEKLGMSKLEEITGRSRKQLYLYLRGFDQRDKEIIIPDNVI
jgi:hypothetical protein